MNENHVVETDRLTKRYGDITAVNHLGLKVRRGEVYGFLGPNGAGKTTTLRMLLGLIRPTSGTATVLGAKPGTAESLVRIGAMVETPGFYPHLSGRDNLRVLAKYSGASETGIDQTLDQVKLLGRAKDAFRTYSMGMKQRLGVAAALLKNPDLLILDEPSNGLDPSGMAEMRSLIRQLGQGDRTVLLSSHLMGEIEQICDRVGIISGGELVAEGTVDELRGEDALLVRADPLEQGRRIAAELDNVRRVDVNDGALRVLPAGNTQIDPAYVNHRLVTAGVSVHELRMNQASLESVFLSLTSSNGHKNSTSVQQELKKELTHA